MVALRCGGCWRTKTQQCSPHKRRTSNFLSFENLSNWLKTFFSRSRTHSVAILCGFHCADYAAIPALATGVWNCVYLPKHVRKAPGADAGPSPQCVHVLGPRRRYVLWTTLNHVTKPLLLYPEPRSVVFVPEWEFSSLACRILSPHTFSSIEFLSLSWSSPIGY